MRHAHAGVAQRDHHAECHRVVGGKNGGRLLRHRQHANAGVIARFFAEIAVELDRLRRCVPISAQSLRGVGVLVGTFDECDARVSEATQMADHRLGAAVVVDADVARDAGVVQQHDRKSGGEIGAQRRGFAIR